MIKAFAVFDADNSGKVSVDVLRLVLTTLGDRFSEEEMEELVSEADMSGEGVVNYEDFVKKIVFA